MLKLRNDSVKINVNQEKKREETGEREKQMNIVATEMITLGDISWDMILSLIHIYFYRFAAGKH